MNISFGIWHNLYTPDYSARKNWYRAIRQNMKALAKDRSRFDELIESISFQVGPANYRIRAEQLRVRLKAFPSLVAAQALIEPLLVWLLWDSANHDALLSWMAAFWLLHLMEVSVWSAYPHSIDDIAICKRWHHHFASFALMAGFMWGLGAFLFFPGDLGHQGILLCILLGLIAGGVVTNQVYPPALLLYTLGLTLPLLARLALSNDVTHWILFVLVAIYVFVLMISARGLHLTFVQALRARFHTEDLAQTLRSRNKDLEQLREELQHANRQLQTHEQQLEMMVKERTNELLFRVDENSAIKEAIIIALSALAEARDNETGNHIRRTQHYMRTLAERLRRHKAFSEFLDSGTIELLFQLAPLHDIGKVGIPDHILLKPGKLSTDEFEIMKRHALLGGNAIAAAEDRIEIVSPFLRIARQIALGHHEKWDGSGYPSGLRGSDIPIPARLMALADVYDALICKRVYKKAYSHEEARDLILQGRGSHFDPDVVDAFLSSQSEFQTIASRFSVRSQ